MTHPVPLRIDFVSDVSCPWCAVGLKALEAAIARVGDEIAVDLHFQPFELNPQMPPEGEDTDDQNVSAHDVLAEIAAEAGLDAAGARSILASDAYAAAVRQQEQLYLGRGITAVPSVIVNDHHLIQGGQPVELFEQALRQAAGLA